VQQWPQQHGFNRGESIRIQKSSRWLRNKIIAFILKRKVKRLLSLPYEKEKACCHEEHLSLEAEVSPSWLERK
jgi:hypothetical protein